MLFLLLLLLLLLLPVPLLLRTSASAPLSFTSSTVQLPSRCMSMESSPGNKQGLGFRNTGSRSLGVRVGYR